MTTAVWIKSICAVGAGRGDDERGLEKPMLAGAVASLAVSAAVWVVLPKFSTREVVADHVILRDVTADHVVPRDVPVDHVVPHETVIEIPRIVMTRPEPSPLARTPDERRFSASDDWTKADVRGRILRTNKNGFDLATEDKGTKNRFSLRGSTPQAILSAKSRREGRRRAVTSTTSAAVPRPMTAVLSLRCRASGARGSDQADRRSGNRWDGPHDSRRRSTLKARAFILAFALLAIPIPASAAYRDPACAKLTFMGIGGEGLMCPSQAGFCPAGTQRYGDECHDPSLVKICPDGAPRARNENCN